MRPLKAIARRSHLVALPLAREYAEGDMLAEVRVERRGKPVFNPATGALAPAAPDVIYSGPARVYDVKGPVQFSVGDEPQYYSSTFVSIPINTTTRPQVDDVVTVTAHLDASLVDRSFRVDDVESGGQLPIVVRMRVTGIQASPQWGS